MNRRTCAVIGDIDNVVLVDLPMNLRVSASYLGRDLILTITPQPALQPSPHRPQSPGVDIDAIHHKYPPRSHEHDQQP